MHYTRKAFDGLIINSREKSTNCEPHFSATKRMQHRNVFQNKLKGKLKTQQATSLILDTKQSLPKILLHHIVARIKKRKQPMNTNKRKSGTLLYKPIHLLMIIKRKQCGTH